MSSSAPPTTLPSPRRGDKDSLWYAQQPQQQQQQEKDDDVSGRVDRGGSFLLDWASAVEEEALASSHRCGLMLLDACRDNTRFFHVFVVKVITWFGAERVG